MVRKRGTVPAENPAPDANTKRKRQEESELTPDMLAQLRLAIEASGVEEEDAHEVESGPIDMDDD